MKVVWRSNPWGIENANGLYHVERCGGGPIRGKLRAGMDFSRLARGVKVQSVWNFEAEWTLAGWKWEWKSNQHGISSKIGLRERKC